MQIACIIHAYTNCMHMLSPLRVYSFATYYAKTSICNRKASHSKPGIRYIHPPYSASIWQALCLLHFDYMHEILGMHMQLLHSTTCIGKINYKFISSLTILVYSVIQCKKDNSMHTKKIKHAGNCISFVAIVLCYAVTKYMHVT